MKQRRATYKYQSQQGLSVRVYRLQPDDTQYLVDLFGHMSPESRYLRFNEYLDHPDSDFVRSRAQQMADVRPKRGAAWLAFADLPGQPHAPVAGARYIVTSEPGVAEVSIAVRDDMQHQGIGSGLLIFLARQAKRHDIHKLVASFHTANRGVWNVLAHAPFHVTTDVHGAETDVVIDLDAPRATEQPFEPVPAQAG